MAPDDQLLAQLRTEDRAITAVFEMSYRGLSPRQRKAFRLCSLHPGPDFTVDTAAVALRCSVGDTERILEDLLDHHLISEPLRGRYRFHDLLRKYAHWLASDEDTERVCRQTVRRILEYYLSIADQADRLLYAHRARLAFPGIDPISNPGSVVTRTDAQAWLKTEHRNLISAARLAPQHGWPVGTAYFAHALASYLESEGYWEEAAKLHERAVDVWRVGDEPVGLAHALADLSLVLWRMGKHDHARESADEALDIRRSLADLTGQADLLDHIGQVHWHQSDFENALTYFQRAYEIRCSTDDRRGQADTLSHIAFALFHTGKYLGARDELQRALAIYATIGDQEGQMMTFNNIGDIELRLGNHDIALHYYERAAKASEMSRQHSAMWQHNMANVLQLSGQHSTALDYYRNALQTYRQISDRRSEADVLINIGSTLQRMGDSDQALVHLREALSTAQEIGERFEQARAYLHMGQAHQQSGHYAAALDCHQQALTIAIQIKDPYEEARALDGIGEAMQHSGNRAAARGRWRIALRLYQQLGVPEAATVQERLQNSTVADDT
jgi:tetratricopeptide (TPR) repeat protein